MPFKPGRSGNPNGRPKGVTSSRLKYRKIFEERGEDVNKKILELALEGDPSLLTYISKVITPLVGKDDFLTGIDLKGSPLDQIKKINEYITEGEITAAEGSKLMENAVTFEKLIQAAQFEERIKKLEKKAGLDK